MTFQTWLRTWRTRLAAWIAPPAAPVLPPVKVTLPVHFQRIYSHLHQMELQAAQARLLMAALPELTVLTRLDFPRDPRAPQALAASTLFDTSQPSSAERQQSELSEPPYVHDIAQQAINAQAARAAQATISQPWRNPHRIRTGKDVRYPTPVTSTPSSFELLGTEVVRGGAAPDIPSPSVNASGLTGFEP